MSKFWLKSKTVWALLTGAGSATGMITGLFTLVTGISLSADEVGVLGLSVDQVGTLLSLLWALWGRWRAEGRLSTLT